MRYLLDTNVCIDAMRHRPEVLARLRACSPDDCALSAVSLFELRSGALKSRRADTQLAKISRLAEIVRILPWDKRAATEAAAIRFHLETTGQKIGAYDTLIAGHAIATELTLVTNNTREFRRVSHMAIEDWRGEGRDQNGT